MSASTTEPVFLHGLRAENFLRLELVELTFGGAGLELVTGSNGEGKSSLLRAIWSALAGRAALPEQPVRHGAEEAEVVVDLGTKIVRLKVKPDRTARLTVEGKDGAQYKAPQKMLDELVGALAFDPLAFASMDASTQANTLRRLVGLDLGDLDRARAELFDERTHLNREAKALEGQLQELPKIAPSSEPVGEETPIAELLRRQRDALAQQSANDAKRAGVARYEKEVEQAKLRVAKLEEELAAARHKLTVTKQAADDLATAAAQLVDPDLEDLGRKIEQVETDNAAVRGRRQLAEKAAAAAEARAKKEKAWEAKRLESAGLTSKIDEIDATKAQRLAAVKFPIDGLSIVEDRVTLRGVPLQQASSAEQLRACLAIAAAMNPRLKLLLIKEGNDLDLTRLREVGAWAKEAGYLILLERVANETPTGIVIEAGRVKEDLRELKGIEAEDDLSL